MFDKCNNVVTLDVQRSALMTRYTANISSVNDSSLRFCPYYIIWAMHMHEQCILQSSEHSSGTGNAALQSGW